MNVLRKLELVVALICPLAFPAWGQSTTSGVIPVSPLDPSEPIIHVHNGRGIMSPPAEEIRDPRRLGMLNAIRQKSMVSDAAKLLRLAQELNAAVSSGKPNLTAQERMHRIAEIEKLAKNVREKMQYTNSLAASPYMDSSTH